MPVYGIRIGAVKSRRGALGYSGRQIGRIGQVAGVNQLINPGFEAGATGWVFPLVAAPGGFEIFDLKEDYPQLIRTGGRSLKIHPPIAGAEVRQLVPATPGQKWLCEAYFRTEYSPDGNIEIHTAWHRADKSYIDEYGGELFSGTNKPWTLERMSGVAVPAGAAYMAIHLYIRNFTGGGFYFVDDCALMLEAAAPAPAPPPSAPVPVEEIDILKAEREKLKVELQTKVDILAKLMGQLGVTPTPEQAKEIAELKVEIANLQTRLVEYAGNIAAAKAELIRRGVTVEGLGRLRRW